MGSNPAQFACGVFSHRHSVLYTYVSVRAKIKSIVYHLVQEFHQSRYINCVIFVVLRYIIKLLPRMLLG